MPIWTEDSQEQFCGLKGEGWKDTGEKGVGKFHLTLSGLQLVQHLLGLIEYGAFSKDELSLAASIIHSHTGLIVIGGWGRLKESLSK